MAGILGGMVDTAPRLLHVRSLGYDIDATSGVAGVHRLRAGATMPPLLLDDDEIVAVAVALRTAATSGVAGIGEHAGRRGQAGTLTAQQITAVSSCAWITRTDLTASHADGSNHTGSSTSADAGTWWPTASTAMTGVASVSTGSHRTTPRPGRGSARGSYRTRI